jgi:hypothetical protein
MQELRTLSITQQTKVLKVSGGITHGRREDLFKLVERGLRQRLMEAPAGVRRLFGCRWPQDAARPVLDALTQTKQVETGPAGVAGIQLCARLRATALAALQRILMRVPSQDGGRPFPGTKEGNVPEARLAVTCSGRGGLFQERVHCCCA